MTDSKGGSGGETWIKREGAEELANRSCVINLSQSAGLGDKRLLKCHLFYLLAQPATLEEQKRYIQDQQSRGRLKCADKSIYTPSHLLFTANPSFEGLEDPVTCDRVITLPGDHDVVQIDFSPFKVTPRERPKNPEVQTETHKAWDDEQPRSGLALARYWAQRIAEAPLMSELESKLESELENGSIPEEIKREAKKRHQALKELNHFEMIRALREYGAKFDTPTAFRRVQTLANELSRRDRDRYIGAYKLVFSEGRKWLGHQLRAGTLFELIWEASEVNGAIADYTAQKLQGQIVRGIITAGLMNLKRAEKKRSGRVS